VAFRAAVIRCAVIIALAVIASVVVAMARESGRCNDDGATYFANRAAATNSSALHPGGAIPRHRASVKTK
jgi:hypothetical protein